MRVEQTEQAAALHQSEAARVVAEEKRLHDAQQSEAVCVVAETTRPVSTGAWWVCGCGWGWGWGWGVGGKEHSSLLPTTLVTQMRTTRRLARAQ
jgi:hypothetical protein